MDQWMRPLKSSGLMISSRTSSKKMGDSKHPGVQWLDRITKYYHSNGPETNSGTPELTSSFPEVVPEVADAVKI